MKKKRVKGTGHRQKQRTRDRVHPQKHAWDGDVSATPPGHSRTGSGKQEPPAHGKPPTRTLTRREKRMILEEQKITKRSERRRAW